MNTYFVSPTGLDTNAGSSTAPWLTLQHAANKVNPGDIVNVEPGSYAGFVLDTNGTATSPITFQRDPAATTPAIILPAPAVPGTQDNCLGSNGNFAIFDGFQIENAPDSGVLIDGVNDIIRNCIVENNGTVNPGVGILTGQDANNIQILNNQCFGNSSHGIYVSGGADFPVIIGNICHDNGDPTRALGGNGIQINADGIDWPTTGAVIDNNVIYHNQASGISLQGAQSSVIENNLVYDNQGPVGVGFVKGSINNVFANNTVVCNVATNGVPEAVLLGEAGNYVPNTGNIFFNNILEADQGIPIVYQTLNPPAASDNNILWAGTAGLPVAANNVTAVYSTLAQWQALGYDLHSQEADPQFVDPTTANYHYLANSPAINTGVASFGTTSAPTTDLDGNPRPIQNLWDIGAYEFTGTVVGSIHFSISAPATTVAGAAFSITVTVLDASNNNNIDTTYAGTIHFTSSDAAAGLPADYTFTSADAGVHTFTNAITLDTAGTQSVTAQDTVTNSFAGSALVTVNPSVTTHFQVSGFPSPTTAGVAHNIAVTAKDAFGNTAKAYTGTVKFTSTDLKAVLPANYTFVAADAGSHTFGLTLKTAGSQSISATDTLTGTITGSQTGITVSPAAANHLVVSGFPSPTSAGVTQTLKVTAQDAFGNTATSYAGKIAFTSTDSQAALPALYTFIGTDAGVHSFSATLKTAGTQSITAKDSVTNSITGTQSGISVKPVAATHLLVSAPTKVTSGTAITITVSAKDPFNNIATSYTGTVHFTSSDGKAKLPLDFTFAAANAGVHTFINGVTLVTTGNQAVTATDTVTSSINGHAVIQVNTTLPGLFGRVVSNGQWWVATSNGSSFTNHLGTTWNPDANWVDVQTGDFNGDGKTDIVGRELLTGNWWLALNSGSTFTTSLWATWNPKATWVDVKVGDFNGDGKDDIVGRYLQGGTWFVGISTGFSFITSQWASWNPKATWVDVHVGDFNGDGFSDLVGRYLQGGSWWVAASTGSSFTTSQWATWNPNVTWVDVNVGDFNGDGKSDIVGRYLQGGAWYVGLSNGSSAFSTNLWALWNPSVTWTDVHVGDFNGDGKDDIIARYLQNGQWFAGISTGIAFNTSLWATWSNSVTWVDVQVGDFNGDGRDDIAGRVLKSGQIWTGLSNGSNAFYTSLWTTWTPEATWADVRLAEQAT